MPLLDPTSVCFFHCSGLLSLSNFSFQLPDFFPFPLIKPSSISQSYHLFDPKSSLALPIPSRRCPLGFLFLHSLKQVTVLYWSRFFQLDYDELSLRFKTLDPWPQAVFLTIFELIWRFRRFYFSRHLSTVYAAANWSWLGFTFRSIFLLNLCFML